MRGQGPLAGAWEPALCALLGVAHIGSLPFVTADADHAVEILVGGATTAATLRVRNVARDPGQQPDVSLVLEAGATRWTALGPDAFSALRNLMGELDRSDVRIGVEGARPNAWASGMQRDMGRGLRLYLLSAPRSPGRPPSARTFDAIPPSEAGTVAEQDAFQREWLPPPQSA